MRKRFLSIAFVVVALLFGAWGNVIAAAFCPRFMLNGDCCLKRGAQPSKRESSCHHEMAGMEMDDMQMETEADSAPDTSAQNSKVEVPSESSNDEVALDDQPIEQCACCLSHSQTTSGTVSVVAIDPSKRLVKTNSLPADFAIGLSPTFAKMIVPSEHSPPGPSTARNVIINVFQI